MKAARGHGPAARLPVPHHRFLRNAAKRKSHQRSSANMRIANALRQSAGLSSRSAKRSLGRSSNNSKRLDNPRPQSASPPPAEETEGDPSMPSDNAANQHGADPGNLRRSTRKRRVLVHVDYESDNSEHEVYRSQSTRVSKHRYTSHTAKAEPTPEEEGSPEPAETKNTDAAAAPRREGLRPRQGIRPPRLELSSQDYEDDDQNSSDREMGMKGKPGSVSAKHNMPRSLVILGNALLLKWNWRLQLSDS